MARSPRPPRKRWPAALAIAVAVAAVLAALYAFGFFSSSSSSSNPAAHDETTGATSSAATAAAASQTSIYGPGPWNPILVAGADPYLPLLASTSIPADTFSFAGDGTCVGHAEGAVNGTVTFPGFDGDLSAGEAPTWLVVEMNATGTMLFVLVINGHPQPIEFFTGPACALFELVGTVPPTMVNSSVAAQAAAGAGLLGFVQAHPHGWTTYDAADVGGTGVWQVEYSTCPAAGKASASTTYYTFKANASLTSGAIVGYPQYGPSSCSGLDLTGPMQSVAAHGALPYDVQGWGPSIGDFVGIGGPVEETNGSQYDYTVNVTSSTGKLLWSDLVFSVRTATNHVPSGPYFVEMRQASGCIVAEGALDDPIYLGALLGGGCSGTQGGSAPVMMGETITIESTVSVAGLGDLFEVHPGSLEYSGNFTMPIP